jgi:hypothetical protein
MGSGRATADRPRPRGPTGLPEETEPRELLIGEHHAHQTAVAAGTAVHVSVAP